MTGARGDLGYETDKRNLGKLSQPINMEQPGSCYLPLNVKFNFKRNLGAMLAINILSCLVFRGEGA